MTVQDGNLTEQENRCARCNKVLESDDRWSVTFSAQELGRGQCRECWDLHLDVEGQVYGV